MSARLICVVNDKVGEGSMLRAEHGVSFWIETGQGVVLFDTGQTAEVFTHNLDTLGLDPAVLNALAISHAHDDHTGGLDVLFCLPDKLPLFANQGLFTRRYSLRDNLYREIGLKASADELAAHFDLRLNDAPQEIIPNLWTTGRIIERAEKVGGSTRHLVKGETGWVQDPYADDLSLVLKTDQGLVLICGCCHAGLLNTLAHVENSFGQKVFHVLGGTHLLTANEMELAYVIKMIEEKYPGSKFSLNHCTGEQAIAAMQQAFGERVVELMPGEWVTLG